MSFASVMGAKLMADDDRSTLLVDDDKVECPTAGFTTIQAAVDKAPAGATIRVCAGRYTEQVTIKQDLEIRGDNGAIILPSSVAANTTSLATDAPIGAVILVMNAERVTLENLTVDGANNGITGCGPGLIGIFYRNASGRIRNVAVRNMALAASLNGCQSGLGIFVQSGNGGASRVEIDGSSVHDFQKNGITGNEAGTDVEITDNAVSGTGPTTGAAQNGIQVGFGARGRVKNNFVANMIWSPCISVTICAFSATGILVFNSDRVTVQENSVSETQGGVFVQGDHGEVEGNVIFDTLILDGVGLMGDGNEVHRNSVTDSDESGVSVVGNDNSVTENLINEAPIGVLKASGSTGDTVSRNRFFNTPVPVKDPPELASTMNRQPYR
jgi:nitrous oxidase accessory protein NosD